MLEDGFGDFLRDCTGLAAGSDCFGKLVMECDVFIPQCIWKVTKHILTL
jgi:hypothetical protein